MIKKYHSLILFLVFISVVSIIAATLSGPSNPTANSIAVFSNNKQLTNSGVTIDVNNNLSGVFALTVTNFYI